MNTLEDKIMADCHKWLWNSFIQLRYCCWHIPNERKQSAVQGAILKAKGVVSGVPDYVINYNSKAYYIEFKNETGKQSESQKTVEIALKAQGFDYVILRSVDEFKKYVFDVILKDTPTA